MVSKVVFFPFLFQNNAVCTQPNTAAWGCPSRQLKRRSAVGHELFIREAPQAALQREAGMLGTAPLTCRPLRSPASPAPRPALLTLLCAQGRCSSLNLTRLPAVWAGSPRGLASGKLMGTEERLGALHLYSLSAMLLWQWLQSSAYGLSSWQRGPSPTALPLTQLQ